MRVLVKDLNQNLFVKINVKSNDTIMILKTKIKENKATMNYDVDDQKLVYSGNILADDSTVEECGFDEQDYVTLVYNPLKKDQVKENAGEAVIDSKIDEIEKSGQGAETENTESFNLSDIEFDDASRNALLASIPNADKFCKIMSENPAELTKLLSKLARKGPSVFEKILSNQQIFINLLDIQLHTAGEEDLDTEGHEAIDRLVEKGFDKDIAVQAYQACDFNENFADELLHALKI